MNISKKTVTDSVSLSNILLKNGVVLAPMTRARVGKERIANALMAEYYVQRARAGLLITEAKPLFQKSLNFLIGDYHVTY